MVGFIFWLLVFASVGYVGFKILRIILYFKYLKFFKVKTTSPAMAEATELVQDPECLVYLSKDRAYSKVILGRPFYFCSQKCAELYLKKS